MKQLLEECVRNCVPEPLGGDPQYVIAKTFNNMFPLIKVEQALSVGTPIELLIAWAFIMATLVDKMGLAAIKAHQPVVGAPRIHPHQEIGLQEAILTNTLTGSQLTHHVALYGSYSAYYNFKLSEFQLPEFQ